MADSRSDRGWGATPSWTISLFLKHKKEKKNENFKNFEDFQQVKNLSCQFVMFKHKYLHLFFLLKKKGIFHYDNEIALNLHRQQYTK